MAGQHRARTGGRCRLLAIAVGVLGLVAACIPHPARVAKPSPAAGQPAVLSGHVGYVFDVAFSPDGKTLASASETVRLWDVAQRKLIRGGVFTDQSTWMCSLAFSPDSTTVAIGDTNGWVWRRLLSDVINAKTESAPALHRGRIQKLGYSSDGKTLISVGLDNTARRYDLAARHEIGEPITFWQRTASSSSGGPQVAISPDGRTLAVGLQGSPDSRIELWDLPTRTKSPEWIPTQPGWVTGLAFSPDGRRLAAGYGSGSRDATTTRYGGVRIWDVAGRTQIGNVFTNQNLDRYWAKAVAFSPDGATLVAAGGKGVHVWDVATGKALGEYGVDISFENISVAFSSDGRTVASGGTDGKVRLWQVNR